MRVIAGSAGGIQLHVPKAGVRPTMDRVKAAIFSSLAEKVVGARVLDLFAGSGALGIEALSRGAASALFIDQDRQAIDTIERNLKKAKVEGQTRQREVFGFLHRQCGSHRQYGSQRQCGSHKADTLGKFDLIFADPPYEQMSSGERFTDTLLANELLPQLLAPNGVFILEKRPGEALSEMSSWKLIRQKKYGATEVLFLAANPESATWHRLPADEVPVRPGPSARGRCHKGSSLDPNPTGMRD
jgi:16S rRNA (guanine966-N2)-methyltransferase